MNPNIEVINDKLWAVPFRYIPYIEDIHIEPDPSIPLEQEPARIAPGGLLILNKDYPGHGILRGIFVELVKMKPSKFHKALKRLSSIKTKTLYQTLYYSALQVEQERRGKERS